MIELRIEQHHVFLKPDTEFDILRENPFFSNAGDYTFDIDVNLSVKDNAELYKFIHRHNSTAKIQNRVAEIRDGVRLLCRGTEAVLQIEDSIAKIQILSDNSELNYLHSTKKIRELDLGVAAYTIETANRDVNKVYPEVNFTFPLVYKSCSGTYREDNSDESFNRNALSNDLASFTYTDADNMIPQPFLLYYVYAIPQALGYKVEECCIDTRKYNKLCIIHGYKTNEFAKMLPNWTVSEFFDEVQKFFNCVFVFDSHKKTVQIISVEAFYRDIGVEQIEDGQVLDECNRKYDEDAPSFLFLSKNVGYKHGSGNYWAFADMDDEVYDRSEKISRRIDGAYEEAYNSHDMQVFYDDTRNVEFIHFEETNGGRYTRLVNQFRHVTENPEMKTELSIVPAVMVMVDFSDDTGYHMYPAPVTSLYSEAAQSSFCDVIRNGLADNASSVMEVAFYGGLRHFRSIDGRLDGFPYGTTQCWTTKWEQRANVIWNRTESFAAPGSVLGEDWDERDTLSLHGEYGKVAQEFDSTIRMDSDKLFVIKFISAQFLDTRKLYLIRNRLFYCRRLKYHVSNNRLEDIVEGEFYPVK